MRTLLQIIEKLVLALTSFSETGDKSSARGGKHPMRKKLSILCGEFELAACDRSKVRILTRLQWLEISMADGNSGSIS